MSSWTYVLIDGINALFGAVSKDAKTKDTVDNIKQAANQAGIKVPDLFAQDQSQTTDRAPVSEPTQHARENSPRFSSNENQISPTKESINLDGVSGKNLAQLKDPRVEKAMRSSHADMKFEQYAKMGLLDLCLKQRKERLKE